MRIRDIRIKLDRPQFTINPTGCAEKQIAAHIVGTGGDLSSPADDTTADLNERFQAADCGALDFAPKLSLRLLGNAKRRGHPALRATLRMPEGGANIARAQVTLPASELLDQGHIGTVCTRVQFAAHACPAASVYGQGTAKTPLFDEPLSGPVYLRSSNNKLPDLVLDLQGKIEVVVSSRVDSIKGGIRNTFEAVPDAPVSSFTLSMQGGKKGLLFNTRNLCAKPARANARFTAHSGAQVTLKPKLKPDCKGKRKGKGKRARRRH